MRAELSLHRHQVTATQIRMWTRKDPLLSRVSRYLHEGWPEQCDDQLKPYWCHKTELSLHDDCLLWGSCVVIPPPGQEVVLGELTCWTSWHFSNEDFGKNVCVVARYEWRHSEDSSVMSHLPTVQIMKQMGSVSFRMELNNGTVCQRHQVRSVNGMIQWIHHPCQQW